MTKKPSAQKTFWLFKSEPSEFGVDDFRDGEPEQWEGIRNYQARNYLRDQVRTGDLVFLYQSSCPNPGITGIMRVNSPAYPDPHQFRRRSKYFDPSSPREAPRWVCVDVVLVEKIEPFISLQLLREQAALTQMELLRKGSRLSIQPVQPPQWRSILLMRKPK